MTVPPGVKELLLSPYHCELLARAIRSTRVSYFTKEERQDLTVLIGLLGYKLEGGPL